MSMPHDEPCFRLPARDPRGHKGDFGSVGVVGGCAGPVRMIGAAVLAARAAYRSGAGLVHLAMPDPVLDAGLSAELHAIGHPLPVDHDDLLMGHEAVAVIDQLCRGVRSLVLGPGMGPGVGVAAAAIRAVQQEYVPAVIDADGLNALSSVPELNREFRGRVVLTPHPGEFRRLGRALGITADPTSPQTRADAAQSLAQRLGCIVVLKGAGTVVTDGHRHWECARGHSVLAVAGTGDVLSGILGGLLAQAEVLGETDVYSLACLAVEAHARAGEIWAERHSASGGLLATELADLLPAVLEAYRDAQPG
ncbi:MAG: NAD(P)H-hydrate dehydratase [Phycisphaeraceae bacterium]|nr:NAD(P)H-hydrate dehydratase [Phycisphaeraceae bacterium]